MLKIAYTLALAATVSIASTSAFSQVTTGFDGNTKYEETLSNFPNEKDSRGALAVEHPVLKRNDAVYAPNGTYLGSDPDANVRLELRRDECISGC